MQKIKKLIAHFLHRVPTMQHFAHLAYFGTVWFEAHHMYGQIAGGLLVLGLLSWLVGEPD